MVDSFYVIKSIFGEYEDILELNELLLHDKSVKFICFTDNPKLKSETWEIQYVNLDKYSYHHRSRFIKTLCGNYLPIDSYILYIDNTVNLRIPPRLIFKNFLKDNDLVFYKHSGRLNLINEFIVCSSYKLDSTKIIFNQFKQYCRLRSLFLIRKPIWGGFILRKNTKSVRETMEKWFQEIINNSKRDQLSLPYILNISKCKINLIQGDNTDCITHKWPISLNRRNYNRENLKNNFLRKPIIFVNFIFYSIKFYGYFFIFQCYSLSTNWKKKSN